MKHVFAHHNLPVFVGKKFQRIFDDKEMLFEDLAICTVDYEF